MSAKVKHKKKEGLAIEPLLTRPESVAIVALGGSCSTFVQEMISRGSGSDPFEEIWTVNRGLRAIVHDKLFVMDDLKWLETKKDGYSDFLKAHDRPIITSQPYDDYPNSIAYPLDKVLECVKNNIFCTNTVAYMVAYAVTIGVKFIYIYGADFFYPNGDKSEEGGQAVAYMLGIAQERGIIYRIPQSSTLLYSHKTQVQNGVPTRVFYGYHRKGTKDAPAA